MTKERRICSDAAWQEIAPILARVKYKAGSPPKQSDRMFLEAVWYIARTGIPWRDLPTEFGHWDAVYNRLRGGSSAGSGSNGGLGYKASSANLPSTFILIVRLRVPTSMLLAR